MRARFNRHSLTAMSPLIILPIVIAASAVGCATSNGATSGGSSTSATLVARAGGPSSAASARSVAVALTDIPEERLDFFEVALVCPAAPKIACGGRAKPALRALVGDPYVDGAWLNEAGTQIAIAWKHSREPVALDQLDDLLTPHGLTVRPLPPNARSGLLSSVRTARWYDSASVDELSDREAGVIATRLVKRLAARTTLTVQQGEQVRGAITEVFRSRFRGGHRGSMDEHLRLAVGPYIGASAVAVFDEVVALGHRPLPGED